MLSDQRDERASGSGGRKGGAAKGKQEVLREGGSSDGLKAGGEPGVRGGDDLRRPWRVEDYEVTRYASGNGNRYERLYGVVDRSGVAVAFFLDRKGAEFAVEAVNGSAQVQA